MIKFRDEKKTDTDYEQDLYNAKVEEALVKWEAAKQRGPSENTEIPCPRSPNLSHLPYKPTVTSS